MAGPSLAELLATIPDPRKPRGRIHPLTAVLSLAAVAMLAGMKSLEAIAQFGRDHGPALAHALGFRRGKTPAKSTLSEIFRAIDPDAFEAALRAWIQGRPAGGDAIALDGKTLKGSRDGELPGAHLLAAFAPGGAAVLGQLGVGAKTNEHKAALRLLGVLPLRGKVVTGDAMFCHRDFARAVRDGGGDYLLVVKDNQPELRAQIEAALHGDADFSPLPAAAEGGGRAGGAGGGQGARAAGVPAADQYDGAQRLPGLAGRRAGLRAGARAGRGREDERRGGAWDHQRGARPGGRGAAAGAGAGPLGDREPAALGA
jgi:DDE_Tnp_1-associated/Transposase DDE domain